MNEKLRQYMDSLFADAPQTAKMVELKEEMLQNLSDKYNDLLSEGKGEEAAYNIAVASIGDVRALIDGMTAEAGGGRRTEAMEKARQRSAVFVSVSIALYVLCVIPLFLLQNEIGLVLMFVVAAIATGLLIYNAASKPHYVKTDDTVVEDFKAWQQEKSSKNRARSAISGAVWLLIVSLYLIISFLTGLWHITWLIFPIGGAVSLIISGIFDLKE